MQRAERSVWRTVAVADGPQCPERSGHVALYAAAQECVYVLGGHNELALEDLWKYRLREQRWEQVRQVFGRDARLCYCTLLFSVLVLCCGVLCGWLVGCLVGFLLTRSGGADAASSAAEGHVHCCDGAQRHFSVWRRA